MLLKKVRPLEIVGHYFLYDTKNPVEIYIDQKLITHVQVAKDGSFKVILPNEYLVPNGLTIRAVQKLDGKILEDVKFIQLLKERE